VLVLSRREAQSIVIGGNVVVTVVSVRGDQVRLGIDAPRSVAVHRQEVAQAIEAANREALAQGELDPAALPQPARRADGAKNAAAGETS
jgi:carbon storage regulator